MIGGKTAFGGFICLSCHIRLPIHGSARARACLYSRLQSGSLRGYIRSNGTSSDTKHHPKATETDQPNQPQNPCQFGHDLRDDHESYDDSRGADETIMRGPRKGRTYFRHLTDIPSYRSRGMELFTTTESLGVGILGRAAEALVMREAGPIERRVLPVDNTDATSPIETQAQPIPNSRGGILESLDDKTGEPSADEVRATIDEMRPKDTTIVPQREFTAIADVLLSGFTTAQLLEYIKDSGTQKEASARSDARCGSVSASAEQPWILDRSPWTPTAADHRNQTSAELDSYVSKSMSPKRVLVFRLIRECWGLSVQELLDGPGQISVKVRDPEFSLLLAGEKRWIRMISRIYLNKVDGCIELRRSDNRMRIVAPKATAETILDELNDILGTIVTKTLDVDLITPGSISPDLIEQLSRLTNSYIRLDNAGRKLCVSWVGRPQKGRSPLWEQTHEVVFRHLLAVYKPKINRNGSPSSPLAILPELHPDADNGRLLVDHTVKQSHTLPWNSRLGSWARWVRPRSCISGEREEPWGEASIPPSLLAHPLEPPKPFNSPRAFMKPSSLDKFWSPATIVTSAVFGHVLHSVPGSQPQMSSSPLSSSLAAAKLDPSLPRILHPITPPLLGQSLGRGDYSTGPASSILVIRLLPSPHDPAVDVAPALEVSLCLYEGGAIIPLYTPDGLGQVGSLKAIQSSETVDVLFPDLPVDVRLVQRHVCEIPGPVVPGHPSLKPLLDFLANSDLSVMENSFSTPSLIPGLGLPSRLMLRSPSQQPPKPKPLGNDSGACVTHVDYLFAGIEVRRSVTTWFRGWSLVYTSVDAGKTGGTRAELSLEARPPVVQPNETAATACQVDDMETHPWKPSRFENPEAATNKFLHDIADLAKGADVKWTT